MSGSSTAQQLPFELLALILDFLDRPSPMQSCMYDNPARILEDDTADRLPPLISSSSASSSFDIPDPSPTDLNNVSLVCRRWRDCALSILFRHVQWKFQSLQRPPPDQDADALLHVDQLEWLRFVRRNELTRYVKSLTIVITYPESKIGEDPMHHQEFGILPSHLIRQHDNQPIPANRDNNWLWRTIFDHIDPTTITLISSPAILASLLGRPIDLSDSWLFRQRFHILSLSRSPLSKAEPVTEQSRPSNLSSSTKRSIPCNLFSIRDWTSLLVNEGSSVRAYATYQYHIHSPPSLLPALFDSSDPSVAKFLSSLSSFSYVAIFPLSTHFTSNLLPLVPSLHRFFIQIVPRELNFAHEPYRRPSIDFNDFWIERNSIYSQLATAIFDAHPTGVWKDLQVFESGDSADLESWDTPIQLVILNAGTRWLISSDGVFTRRPHRFPNHFISSPYSMAVSAQAF